jgi:hypothetical protein
MIVPRTSGAARIARTLATAGRSGAATRRLRLTVFTSVDWLNFCGCGLVGPQRVFRVGRYDINAVTVISRVVALLVMRQRRVRQLLPTASEVPSIDVGHIESRAGNPLGVKGMGEGGAIASPAAVVNAVADALAPLGVKVSGSPLGPKQVLDMVAAAGR